MIVTFVCNFPDLIEDTYSSGKVEDEIIDFIKNGQGASGIHIQYDIPFPEPQKVEPFAHTS